MTSSTKAIRVILRAQARVREINTERALLEIKELTDITQLDWLMARGDRRVLESEGMFDTTDNCNTTYNSQLTERIAEEVYLFSIENKSVPCLPRGVRHKKAAKK